MKKISAVIITYNAEKHLAKVLERLKDIASEIIIVDSGSTDQTMIIAKKFKSRIFKQKWLGYARQKNFGLDRAKNDWILSLDADEVVDDELAESIKKADPKHFNGYYIAFKNYFDVEWVRYGGWYPDWHLRLFNKNMMRFQIKEVHEQIKPIGNIGYLKGNILHYTYNSNKHYFQKIEKYTALDAEYLFGKGRKWTMFYQIGKPIKEFFQMYFSKKGFMDGFLGLKIALYSAIYRYKVAEKLHKLYKT